MTIEQLNAKLKEFSRAKRAEVKLRMQLKGLSAKVDKLAKSVIGGRN
jgi:hypothetical protein